MNQDAFRNLLSSAPSGRAGGPGRPPGVLGGAAPKRGKVGGGSSKALDLKELAAKPAEQPKAAAPPPRAEPAFVPRKTAKKNGKYVDRAEMRRQGLENEYQPVEKLLEDFEARAKENGEDAETIDKQTREYLGGDAQHSILIRGLDYNLLAARKAELEAQAASAYDEDLEAALGEGQGEGANGPAPPVPPPVKTRPDRPKTRDEIVAELKRKRMGAREDEDEDDLMGVKKTRAVEAVAEETKAPALSSKFNSIVKRPDPVPERKIRKKKKNKVAPEDSVAGPSTARRLRTPSEPDKVHHADVSAAAARSLMDTPALPSAALPLPPANDEEEDDDEDIFGGVGDYEVHIDSDDEDGEAPRTDPPPAAAPGPVDDAAPPRPRRNWFGDVEEPSPEPPASAPRPPRPRENLSRSPSPDPRTLTRLQPLSSHGPSAREMLDAADEADRLAKRRANKAKWRAKQGLPAQVGQDGDDEDESLGRKVDDKETRKKLQKDTNRLSMYMANKKKKEGG